MAVPEKIVPIRPPRPNTCANEKLRSLDKAGRVLAARHFAASTQKAYLFWIERFLELHESEDPKRLSEPEVNDFLTKLATEGQVAASTQNQALCACCFSTTMRNMRYGIKGMSGMRRPWGASDHLWR